MYIIPRGVSTPRPFHALDPDLFNHQAGSCPHGHSIFMLLLFEK